MNRLLARPFAALGSTLVAVVVILGFTAGPALAQGTAPSANALNVTGLVSLTTGLCTGSTSTGGTGACGNQGSQTNTLVDVGVLTQVATTSAACAGATGPGGSLLQIGTGGTCAPASNVSNGGINLLNGLITANAIYAVCQVNPNGGAPTASFQLVGLSVGNALSGVAGLAGLPTAAQLQAGGTFTVAIAGTPLLTISTGQPQTFTISGTPYTSTITALDVNVLPSLAAGALLGLGTGGAIHIDIGSVSCPTVTPTTTTTTTSSTTTTSPPGSTTTTTGAVIAAFPHQGWPIAGGVLALVGLGAFLGRRRLFAALRD